MSRRRLVGFLAWLVVLSVGCGGAPAAAQEEMHRAGLIVRHGDGRLTYAYVAFEEETISGIELLRRSGVPLVTVSFGGLGEGVCSLEGEGCPAAECRRRVCQGSGADDPFWQYFRQDAPGRWRALVLGASASEVRDGDVDGWSWTGGEPGLPAASIEDIARLTGGEADLASSREGGPTAAVHTVYPQGVEPKPAEPGQDWPAYASATGILATIGAGVLYAARRRRRLERQAA